MNTLDALSRVTSTRTFAPGSTTALNEVSVTYNVQQKVASVTDPAGRVTEFEYNARESESSPDDSSTVNLWKRRSSTMTRGSQKRQSMKQGGLQSICITTSTSWLWLSPLHLMELLSDLSPPIPMITLVADKGDKANRRRVEVRLQWHWMAFVDRRSSGSQNDV